MNPWLEQFWRDVHTSLTTYTRDAVQALLPGGMRAVVEEYLGVVDRWDDSTIRSRVAPDVSMLGERPGRGGGTAVAVAPPAAGASVGYAIGRGDEAPTLRYIEILDVSTGRRLVTAIEFLSPVNKSGPGRRQYQRKQEKLIAGGVNLVEIDLLRSGSWVVAAPRSACPAVVCGPYRICVTPADVDRETIMYPAGFDQPLPRIAIPLRPGDDDIVLPLQPILQQAYVNGRYGEEIDYQVPPHPPLDDVQRVQMKSYL